MEFIIEERIDHYIIYLDKKGIWIWSNDIETANKLGITLNEYQNILKSHNGTINIFNEIYLPSRLDAEMAIKTLEPYLVLATLTGD